MVARDSRLPPAEASGGSADQPPPRFRRLLVTLFTGNAALLALTIGAGTVLLPLQVERIESGSVRSALGLSAVTGSAALVSACSQPLFGALSDRSRRRHPWIIAGTLTAAAGAAAMAGLDSVALLALAWCLVSLAQSMYQAALTAVVPDRVPEQRRGLASALVGAAAAVASVAGIAIAAGAGNDLRAGYLRLALLLAAAGIAFVTVNRETPLPPQDKPAPRASWRSSLGALRSGDFRAAFLARAAIMFGFYLVFAYMLYILQHRVQLPAGVPARSAFTVLAAIAATAMIGGTVAGGILADRLRRYRAIGLSGATLMFAATLPPLASRSLAAAACYVALAALGFGCFLAVDTAIVTLVLPRSADAARDLGVLNIATTAPQTGAAFAAGLIVAAGGGGPAAYGSLFAVTAVFSVLGGVCLRAIKGVP
jgi:predicted MFS family arabinose efflux permease